MHQYIKNAFNTLGLPVDATRRETVVAYRKLSLKFHPDLNKAPEAEEQFKKLKPAYDILNEYFEKSETKQEHTTEPEHRSSNAQKPKPKAEFNDELIHLAQNTGHLSEQRKADLLDIITRVPSFLTSALDSDGNTFLHLVFQENNAHIIHKLVKHPLWETLPKVVNKHNLSLFHVIADTGFDEHYECLKHLSTNQSDQAFALYLSAKNGHVEFLRKLLDDHIDPDLIFEGNTALNIAASKGHQSICNLLLDAGANPAFKNQKGKSAEELWSKPDKKNPITEFYRELHALATGTGNLSKERKIALLAIITQHTHFLTLELDSDGNSFLHLVFRANNMDIICELVTLPQWKTLSQTVNKHHQSLFHVIAEMSFDEHYEYLKHLSTNQSDQAFALYSSAKNGNIVFLMKLLADHVNPDLIFEGNTALTVAASNSQYSICNQLLTAGANPALKNQERKSAKELWAHPNKKNPITEFYRELHALATGTGNLSKERKIALLAIITQHTHFLTAELDSDGNSFLHLVFRANNMDIIRELVTLPQWKTLSQTVNKHHQSLFHVIAEMGFDEHYEYLKHLSTNQSDQALALHLSAKNGHIGFLSKLLADNVNPDLTFRGNTALIIASNNGKYSIFKQLLAAGANPALTNIEGKSAEELWYGANDEINPITRFYYELHALATNANNLSNREKMALLKTIMQHTHFLTVELDGDGNTFLHLVFRTNNTNIIRKLVELPQWETLSKTVNKRHWSLFHVIAANGFDEHYEHLKHLSTNQSDQAFALYSSALNGHIEFLRKLLADNVNPELTFKGNIPLIIAASNGQHSICKQLLAAGANPARTNHEGKTAEKLWSSSSKTNPIIGFYHELYDLATNSGNLSNQRKVELLAIITQHTHFLTAELDGDWNTFLHLAFSVNNTQIIRELMKLPLWETLCKTVNKRHWSLFHVIAAQGFDEHYECLKHLSTNQYDQALALYLSSLNGHVEFLKKLLADHINPDLILEGNTALIVAASNGHRSICNQLLAAGANPALTNHEGKTAENMWPNQSTLKQINPFLQLRLLEQKKSQIIELLKPKISSAVWKWSSSFFQNGNIWDDLAQRINLATFNLEDNQNQTADVMLNVIINTWELTHPQAHTSNQDLFFSQPSDKMVLQAIKELVNPEVSAPPNEQRL